MKKYVPDTDTPIENAELLATKEELDKAKAELQSAQDRISELDSVLNGDFANISTKNSPTNQLNLIR